MLWAAPSRYAIRFAETGLEGFVAEWIMPVSVAGNRDLGLSNFFSTPYQVHNHARLAHLESLGLPLANRRVIELGSGPGDHTGFYVRRGCAVVSVDARLDCLDVLKKRYPDAGPCCAI